MKSRAERSETNGFRGGGLALTGRTAVPMSSTSTWWGWTSTPTRTPTTPWPPTAAHSWPRRSDAVWTARLWALEAAAISPGTRVQVHTPGRHRGHRDPEDELDRFPADRVQEQRLVDAEVRGHGRRSGARAPSASNAAAATHLGSQVDRGTGEYRHVSRTVGCGAGHRVEVLEPPHPGAPKRALEDLVAGADLALGGARPTRRGECRTPAGAARARGPARGRPRARS